MNTNTVQTNPGHANQRTMRRVRSSDGTAIACWTSGTGPPLVLVHGTTSSHATWQPLLPYLEPHSQVVTIDRRGRGESGDAPSYSLLREEEDLAAVVEALAAEHGRPVDVLGHSFGGECAFGAALLTTQIRRLVLYEGWPVPEPALVAGPPELRRRLEELAAQGRPEELLELFYRELVQLTPQDLDALRAAPNWSARVAAAATVPREVAAVANDVLDPTEAAKVTVPVLLVVGELSSPELRGDPEALLRALPDARVIELPGQQHVAHLAAPELLAERVVNFLAR